MTITVHIRRVTEWQRGSGGSIFIVESREPEGQSYHPYILRTFSPWVATLCKQAWQHRTPVSLEIERATDAAFGWRIKDVIGRVA